MKKIVSIMVFILALSSCQTNQEQNIAPAEKNVANNKANLRPDGVKDAILLDENIKDGDVMTATLVARRGDRNLSKYYQQVFEKYPLCQAIFIDNISKFEFGYIKELSLRQTTLKGIVCKKCIENGVVIQINQPKSNVEARFIGGCWSEWARAVFF